MVTLDQSVVASQRVQARAQSLSDRQIIVLVMTMVGIVGGLLVGGLATLVFGTLPGWIWFVIIGVEVLAALFLAGAMQAAKS